MTREELIEAIWDNEDAWSCPKYNCDEPEEEGNTGECCKKCAENLLIEYEKQIRAEVIAEVKKKIAFEEKWLIRAINEDKGHYLYNIDIAFYGIYHSLEQLKEQKGE